MYQRSLLLVAGLCVIACAVRQVAPATPTGNKQDSTQEIGQLTRDVVPVGYTLELSVLPKEPRFFGRAQIVVQLKKPTQRVLLHGMDLRVSEVYAEVGGSRVAGTYTQLDEDGLAQVAFDQPLAAGRAVLSLRYEADFDKTLRGLYQVEFEGLEYAFTQFEPYSARSAFPCFDEPGFKTPFDLWLTIRAEDVAIANTPQVSQEDIEGGYKRLHFATTKPLPTYLLAMAVGPLDIAEGTALPPTALRDHTIPFRGVAARGQKERLAYAMERVPAIVAQLERYFGIPYPFEKLDIIAVPDFAAGAMENAGAITFRDYLLLIDEDSASEHQKRSFAYVMAHELAHQWFGNLVTMSWWDDLWLNEAFATWMGYAVVDALWPAQQAHLSLLASAHYAMDEDSLLSARVIRQPIETTHDISSAFDSITYSKGGAVLNMFERYLGTDIFQRGIQRYLKAHLYGNATSHDLLLALSEEAGENVEPAFDSFLTQPGVPLIAADVQCSEKQGKVQLQQSRYLPAGSKGKSDQTWRIPLCVAYGVGHSRQQVCRMLEAREATWNLQGCPDWLMPNADASGYFLWTLPPDELAALRDQGLSQLSVRERVSFAHALEAAFDSGDMKAADILAVLPRLSVADERAVARAPMALLRFIRDHVASAETRPLVEAYARGLYAPALSRLGITQRASDDGETTMLRAEVLSFLARVGDDTSVRKRLAKIGTKALRDPEAPQAGIEADVLAVAMRVAMEDGDSKLFKIAYERFIATPDPAERSRLLAALTSVRDERSTQALALALDPELRVNEVLTVLSNQFSDEATRKAAWQYVVAHYDVLAKRVSSSNLAHLPLLTTGFCSQEHLDRLQEFFSKRAEALQGGPRALAEASESLALCQARVAAQKASVEAFFHKP